MSRYVVNHRDKSLMRLIPGQSPYFNDTPLSLKPVKRAPEESVSRLVFGPIITHTQRQMFISTSIPDKLNSLLILAPP